MSSIQLKITGYTNKYYQDKKKKKQNIEIDQQVIQTLELSDIGFKIAVKKKIYIYAKRIWGKN